MTNLSMETEALLRERFGQDRILSLATAVDNVPYVRCVDGFYENGAFYVLTHSLSGKMQQIRQNPMVALAGEWFTAQGIGKNLGFFGSQENAGIANRMKGIFSAWIDNGHTDLADPNTCILRIDLTGGVLFANGTRYEIDFSE